VDFLLFVGVIFDPRGMHFIFCGISIPVDEFLGIMR